MMEKTKYIIKKKDGINGLAKYVIFSLAMVIIFTIVMIILFCKYQMIPSDLIPWFFGIFGGEVLTCAMIKMFKLKAKDDESE